MAAWMNASVFHVLQKYLMCAFAQFDGKSIVVD